MITPLQPIAFCEGIYVFDEGRVLYDAARENFQQAANLAKSLLGDHEVTASQFELLATAYLKMGKYRGALDAYQESRAIRVKLLCEHRDIAMSFDIY